MNYVLGTKCATTITTITTNNITTKITTITSNTNDNTNTNTTTQHHSPLLKERSNSRSWNSRTASQVRGRHTTSKHTQHPTPHQTNLRPDFLNKNGGERSMTLVRCFQGPNFHRVCSPRVRQNRLGSLSQWVTCHGCFTVCWYSTRTD